MSATSAHGGYDGPRLTVHLTSQQDGVLSRRAAALHRSRAAHVRALIEEDGRRADLKIAPQAAA